MLASVSPATRRGVFSRIKNYLVGEIPDAEKQVRAKQREGVHLMRLAHTAATIMVILVSVAALITLGRTTVERFVASTQGGHPDFVLGVSIALLFGMVFCADLSMIYGTFSIRLRIERGAKKRTMIIHTLVVLFVVALEGTTYYLMSMTYEPPKNQTEFLLVCARSFGAPLLACYLILAQVLPVTAKDILNQAAVSTGITMLTEIARLASNELIPLPQKFALFHAAAEMPEPEEKRMTKIILVASWTPESGVPLLPGLEALTPQGRTFVEPSEPVLEPASGSVRPTGPLTFASTAPAPVVKMHHATPGVQTAYSDERVGELVELALANDPHAKPSAIAQATGLTVPQVCKYLVKLVSSGRAIPTL